MNVYRTLFIIFCSFSVHALHSQEKPKVVASASMISDMANNLGGDLIELECIVPIGGDPHLHSPTPRDAKLVASADLILINGLTFEGWINELIENSGTKGDIVTVTKGVKPIMNEKYKSSDPHAWMDANNGLMYAENISKALKNLLPDKYEILDSLLISYKRKIMEVDAFILSEIQKIPEKQRILITSHDAFAYYGKRYGVRLEAIMGISTEAEAQTSDIIRVTNIIRDYNIPAVFVESTINPKLLQQIASDNKVRIGGKLFADSIGDKDSPAPSYLDMLKHNTRTIVKALSNESEEQDNAEIPVENTRLKWILYLAIFGLLALSMIFMARKLN